MSTRKKRDPYKGKKVHALPLRREVMNWLKRHAGKGEDWTVVTLACRDGEYLSVSAADGTGKVFGPHDMTWAPIESYEVKSERLVKMTANAIADWVQDRDPLLAIAIRQGKWRGNKGSSKFLTIGPEDK